jgi:hypothetical protein
MPYKHVLAVYDGTDLAKEVLQMVCRFLRPERGRMTILVLRVLPLSAEIPAHEAGADPDVDAMVREAGHLVDRCGIKAATSVRYARSLGLAVVAEARLHGADLLALAVPDLDRLTGEQRWHADLRAILRDTTCAIMLLRPGRA